MSKENMNPAGLNQQYWDTQYQNQTTGWDLGAVSPPLKAYIDSLHNTQIDILIPGCGNAYEAEYLAQKGFKQITLLDISPTLVEKLRVQFANYPEIQVVQGDFFEHQGQYDLILEQTFFCALPPSKRQHYVAKMHELLRPEGLLSGVLFNREFDNNPPFGGSFLEYEALFGTVFLLEKLAPCSDSAKPRANTELSIIARKKTA